MTEPTWVVKYLQRDGGWEGPLFAAWEVARDPISDDYTPDETSADKLLPDLRASRRREISDDLIPTSSRTPKRVSRWLRTARSHCAYPSADADV